MIVVGFTGTRRGLTVEQRIALRHAFSNIERGVLGDVTLVHGGCVGADAEAHEEALDHCFAIEIYPSDIPSMYAKELAYDAMVVHEPRPPLVRNRLIVERCTYLIACPGEPVEQLRSGTWATVRYARAAGKRVWLGLPDGSFAPCM